MLELIKKLSRRLTLLLPASTKHIGKLLLLSNYRHNYLERRRLGSTPRHSRSTTNILGPELVLTDAASFIPTYDEIFTQEIYKFESRSLQPKIIDCGANIGLSIIYFKLLYPQCRIIAFEPDPVIFETLKINLDSFKITDVTLINKAVWSSETVLTFFSEGSDSGRLSEKIEGASQYSVETIRLEQFLQESVELLKIDIEGAETEVILNLKHLLTNVKNIFIEYHSFTDKPQTLIQLLEVLDQSGFRLQIQNPYPFNKRPLYDKRVIAGMDLLLTIFGYRNIETVLADASTSDLR